MTSGIALIYARAANGVIGRDGALPWHIPADLRRFKALTLGHPMIMGRKTFESFPRPLPGRRHVVVTRNRRWTREGAEVAHDPDEALHLASGGLAWVIGGADLIAHFEPLAFRAELTEVHAEFEGDTRVAPLGPDWCETAREDHAAEGGTPAFSFVTLERAA